MAIIKTYPLKSNYYGPDRIILSDMQPDDQGIVHGFTKNMTLSNLKSFIGSGSSSFTLETVGTSGAATFDTNTNILNIPDYSISNPVDGSGTAGRIPKWSDSNTLGDSQIFQSVSSIGIGTVNPTGSLEVYNGSLNNQLFITCPDTSQAAINFGGTSSKSKGRIGYSDNSDVMYFHTNSSEKMRILSNGNVGIGTTAPLKALEVNGDFSARNIESIGNNTGVTFPAVLGWYRIMEWGGASRGGTVIKLSTTGGSVAPTTYVMSVYKTYDNGSAPASSNTLKLEQYGANAYLSKARIATDSVTNISYLEVYLNALGSGGSAVPMVLFHDSLLGIDNNTVALSGTVTIAPATSLSQQELPFTIEGTTTQKFISRDVTLYGDGSTNAGKLKFNCSANTHYTEIIGPDHSGGASYSLKLPNTLPSISNQILEANALGTLSWIPTPSGGGGGGGTLNTVGLTMPSAFSVGNSPLTGTGGTISVTTTGGSAGQYLDYLGSWSTPTGTYALPQATNTVRGGIELGSNSQLTAQITAGSAGVAGKTYPVQLNSGGQAAVYVPWANTVVSPGGSSGSVQFRNALGNFTGGDSLLFDGSGILTVGEAGGDRGIVIIEPDPGADSGILKIGHSNETNYISLGIGEDSMSTNYSIDLPVAAPGGNNKILESNSSGQLSWITTPTYTLPEATATVRGGIELFSNTTQATAANSVTTTASRTYGIQLNAANQAVVNVPWVGGGTGSPAGVANNVQFSDGTSFSADVNFNWDASINKLILGKDSTPQFQEGILRLLGDGQGGTAGTIEFQSAQGKSGGAAATVKLQGPVSGVTQEILLPKDLPTANTQILGIDTIVGTKVTTQWETPSTGTTYTPGTGITINSGNEIINTDLGSSQSIFKNISASTGGTATANSNNDTLTIAAGTGISTTRSGDTITIASTGTGSSNIGFQCYNMYEALDQVPKAASSLVYVKMMVVPQDTSPVNRVSFFCTSLGNGAGSTNPGTVQVSVFRAASLNPSVNGSAILMGSIDSNTMVVNAINTISFAYEGDPISYSFTAGDRIAVVVAMYNGVKLAGTTVGLANDGLSRKYQSNFSSWTLPEQFEDLDDYLTDNGITTANSEGAALTFWAT